MINIVIFNKKDKINKIEIKGHANYAPYGCDIVCASVSSIIATSVNACLSFSNSIKTEDNNRVLKIIILKHDEITINLINNMVNMLKELEKQFKKYIKVRKKEENNE